MITNRLIYSEFFAGFVRGRLLDGNYQPIGDTHLGHLTGMSLLQQGPDGFLYAVSLFGNNHVLRVDLAP
ncbi:MAG: hypothetical protein U1F57_10890 [bacterium]